MRRHWARSVIRDHNARMVEKGYDAAVIPLPSYGKSVRRFVTSIYWSGREKLAFRLAPWLRDV